MFRLWYVVADLQYDTYYYRSPLRLNFVDVARARHSKQAIYDLSLNHFRQRCGQSTRNKY